MGMANSGELVVVPNFTGIRSIRKGVPCVALSLSINISIRRYYKITAWVFQLRRMDGSVIQIYIATNLK